MENNTTAAPEHRKRKNYYIFVCIICFCFMLCVPQQQQQHSHCTMFVVSEFALRTYLFIRESVHTRVEESMNFSTVWAFLYEFHNKIYFAAIDIELDIIFLRRSPLFTHSDIIVAALISLSFSPRSLIAATTTSLERCSVGWIKATENRKFIDKLWLFVCSS